MAPVRTKLNSNTMGMFAGIGALLHVVHKQSDSKNLQRKHVFWTRGSLKNEMLHAWTAAWLNKKLLQFGICLMNKTDREFSAFSTGYS